MKIIYKKKGNKSSIVNYRPLIMVSHMSKLFFKIILNRLRNDLEDLLVDNQYGFIKGKDTVKQLVNLYNCINTRKYNYAISLDIRKAYDSVDRRLLFRILKNINLNEIYIRVLENYYSKSIYWYRKELVQVNKGVKQYNPFFPILFNLYINQIGR